jgi:hypothetical protein
MKLLRVGRKMGLTHGVSSLLAEVDEREGRERVLEAVRGGGPELMLSAARSCFHSVHTCLLRPTSTSRAKGQRAAQ